MNSNPYQHPISTLSAPLDYSLHPRFKNFIVLIFMYYFTSWPFLLWALLTRTLSILSRSTLTTNLGSFGIKSLALHPPPEGSGFSATFG
jgi:hypothetical protein